MLSEIIELLSDDRQSLASALLKTQVLASRLGNEELKQWAINESKGYRNGAMLPPYRQAKAATKCSINYVDNQPIPLMIFSEKPRQVLVKISLDEGVKALEEISSGKYGEYIAKEFGEDFGGWLTQDARANGHKVFISNVRVMAHIGEVTHTLGEIRSRLLELMLQLEKLYPDLENEIKKKSVDTITVNQTIYHIMSQVNITTNGDGNVTNTGDNNTFNVNTNINKGDVGSLRESLEKINVSKEDIDEVVEIIANDVPNYETKALGKQTRGWISKMLDKSMEGSWQIATGAAGGLLTELFKNFFGL
jgi:transcriptional regulator NrdR family protein